MGLHLLKRRCLLAPVSNGNISLMVDLARRNNLPWDAILGSEIAGDYKPKPRVYLAAAEAFDLPPSACMMVAAHTNDLLRAAECGLRTAHVARPNEKGPGAAKPRRRHRWTSRSLPSRNSRISSTGPDPEKLPGFSHANHAQSQELGSAPRFDLRFNLNKLHRDGVRSFRLPAEFTRDTAGKMR